MPRLDPPVPVSAVDIIFETLITFNHPLIPGSLDPTNWSVRVNNQRHGITIAGVPAFTPTIVDIRHEPGFIPDPGPNAVFYTPPPFDVISDTAKQIPAAAFAEFPVT